MELQQILDAIGQNPSLVEGLIQPVFESEKGKLALTNRVTTEVNEKIAEEISKTHKRYDDDIFEVLGERPGTKEDGKKQKTYEFLKDKLQELKTLSGQKDSLTKDAEVQRLTAEIAELKKSGGGALVQQQFEAYKAAAEAKEADYLRKIEEAGKAGVQYQMKSQFATAKAGLAFNPDVDEEIRNIVLDKAENDLLANAKEVDGKIVFHKADGKPYLDPVTFEPQSAADILKSHDGVLKLLKKEGQQGGGADPIITGKVTTIKVEGKDVKKLDIPAGSFKTQTEFYDKAHKLLTESGISKSDNDYHSIIDNTVKELNVSSLPAQ